jgi:hydrogenase maturation protease
LIAGMGNVLRRDDGFGVEVARRLARETALPADVTVIEVGIGGIHLVQELMNGYDALVVIDAVERGSAPGTMHLLAVDVPDLADWSEEQRGDFLADTHYTTPAKAMILAKAIGVLPRRVVMLGCQPLDAQNLGLGLTDEVGRTADAAVAAVARLIPWLDDTAADGDQPRAATLHPGHGHG